MWPAVFPVADVPLWHEAHAPLTTEWSNRTFVQEAELWHCSHSPDVWTCVIDFPGARIPS
jgi:hypothetical protein